MRSGYSQSSDAGIVNPRARQRAICIGALPKIAEEDPLAELRELLRTAGVAVAGELLQQRAHPDPNTYLGRGKLEELKALIRLSNANLVACDDELSPRQERNLEERVGVPVIDRTATILDIFADHASSAEGKLQVELAQLEYNMARMRGLWTHLERLGGGIGTRGPGETQIETDRRLARNRTKMLKRKIDHERGRRFLMRKERESTAMPSIALAGYTNAGKSTLMNTLTGSDVGVTERLFQTLDPTTRAFDRDGRTFLLTDTVGFIRKLPHQLIEAFGATLEETKVADLIVHVVDADEEEEELGARIEVVERVLVEIGVAETPKLLAFNKIDLISATKRGELQFRHPDAVQLSAMRGDGIEDLKTAIAKVCRGSWRQIELLVPYDEGDIVSELHDLAGDLTRQETPDGVRVVARVPQALAQKFERYALNGPQPGDEGS